MLLNVPPSDFIVRNFAGKRLWSAPSSAFDVPTAIPYQTERLRVGDGTSGIGRKVIKAGIRFSMETLAIEDWEVEE